MAHQVNAVHACYELLEGNVALLRLRPFLPFRRQDAALNRDDATFEIDQVAVGRWDVRLPAVRWRFAWRCCQVMIDFILRQRQPGTSCYGANSCGLRMSRDDVQSRLFRDRATDWVPGHVCGDY